MHSQALKKLKDNHSSIFNDLEKKCEAFQSMIEDKKRIEEKLRA